MNQDGNIAIFMSYAQSFGQLQVNDTTNCETYIASCRLNTPNPRMIQSQVRCEWSKIQ
jgi:hypothetical protein